MKPGDKVYQLVRMGQKSPLPDVYSIVTGVVVDVPNHGLVIVAREGNFVNCEAKDHFDRWHPSPESAVESFIAERQTAHDEECTRIRQALQT